MAGGAPAASPGGARVEWGVCSGGVGVDRGSNIECGAAARVGAAAAPAGGARAKRRVRGGGLGSVRGGEIGGDRGGGRGSEGALRREVAAAGGRAEAAVDLGGEPPARCGSVKLPWSPRNRGELERVGEQPRSPRSRGRLERVVEPWSPIWLGTRLRDVQRRVHAHR